MARTSSGTGSTSNYGLNSTSGLSYTASQKFTIFAIISINDVTQSDGYLWMSRVAGGGAFIGIGFRQASKSVRLITASGDVANSQIDFTSQQGVYRYCCWNKSGSGLGLFEVWTGTPGSASTSDKVFTNASHSAITDSLSGANRTTMFAAWGAGDTIAAPLGCKAQAVCVLMGNQNYGDSDIVSIANGTLPSTLTSPAAPTLAYNMPNSETGNIIDSGTSGFNLTVSGTIGQDAGPFASGGGAAIRARYYANLMES